MVSSCGDIVLPLAECMFNALIERITAILGDHPIWSRVTGFLSGQLFEAH